MPAYKDEKRGTWYTAFYYEDWQGNRKKKMKRGFPTKKEALAYEREFLMQESSDLNMTFESFYQIYERDMQNRIRKHTWETKRAVVESKILPYFGQMKLCDIKTKQILAWQNEMMGMKKKDGKPYKPGYLKTIHNQLSAIFNHAKRYYGLKDNPAAIVGNMGKESKEEMKFWTMEQYEKFSLSMMEKPMSYYGFQILYWCGIRVGELLALTPADFDFEKNRLSITKSYQRIKGEDEITPPKTEQSIRTIDMPNEIAAEIQEYIKSFYKLGKDDRLFPVTKRYFEHEMIRGTEEQGLERIRVHDLRHSHVSLLINMGFTAVDIAGRIGHTSLEVTLRYAHMFPSKQQEMVDKLNKAIEGGKENE